MSLPKDPPQYEPLKSPNDDTPRYTPSGVYDEEAGLHPNSATTDGYISLKLSDCSSEIRTAFVRKVYTILTAQLFLTAFISTIIYSIDPIREYVQTSPWILITACVLSIVLLCPTIAYRRSHPTNLYLLAAFTFCIGYTVGASVSFYDSITVLQAVLITMFVFVGLTVYTMNSKRDFSGLGPYLYTALLVLIFTSIVQLIMMAFMQVVSPVFSFFVSGASALVFSLYIVYDTYMIFNKMSVEDYVVASIELYLDIINLFLSILRIIGYLNGSSRS